MKKIITKLLLFILAFNLISCSKDDDTSPNNNSGGSTQNGITVSTIDATNIKTILATSNCKVVVDPALNSITQKGVIWSTSQNPTIALNTKTSDGIATGDYQSQITNLQSNTKYYIKGYAIATNGNVVYGNEISFTTKMGWKEVSTSSSHSIAIKDDGTLWAWGRNENGQIGNGSIINQNIPVQIGADKDWSIISTSPNNNSSSYAIKNDGTLWSWGLNSGGRLGDGTMVDKYIPTKIGSSSWKKIVSSGLYIIGLRTDGSVWYWGNGAVLTTLNADLQLTTPKLMSVIGNCKDIGVDGQSAVFIKNDGTLWEWINNTISPVQVGVYNDWQKLFCGSSAKFGFRSNGSVWAKGLGGSSGIFGNGGSADLLSFTEISNNLGTYTNKLTVGTSYIKNDGTLWKTGSGYLGDGSPVGTRFIFTKMGIQNIWKSENGNFAIQNNGSLWVCGEANVELGIGINTTQQFLTYILVD